MDTVLSLPATHQISVVVATHNPAFSERCDRILRVQAGQVIEEKPRPGGA
jgi:predicted ABC-type transport system involved in lysophospholipase L1 biosynthesis ATPase subunit